MDGASRELGQEPEATRGRRRPARRRRRLRLLLAAASWFALVVTGLAVAPALLPPQPAGDGYHLVVDKRRNRLYVFDQGRRLAVYTVATGRRPGLTPEGAFPIVRKLNLDARSSGAATAFGSRWMGLAVPIAGDRRAREGYRFGIHGTDEPGSVGRHVSSGCIRMRNADVEALYERTPLGTKVHIRSGWGLRLWWPWTGRSTAWTPGEPPAGAGCPPPGGLAGDAQS